MSCRLVAVPSRSTAFVVISSSSVVGYITYRILQWRARLRARQIAARAERIVRAGPVVDCSDEQVRCRILSAAKKRGSKWIEFLPLSEATPMPSQVGGLSSTKRPILTLAPDYALKPLHTDDRGFRETAFYEAIKLAITTNNSNPNGTAAAARTLASMRLPSFDESGRRGDDAMIMGSCDVLAMNLAILVRDSVVAESKTTLVSSWERIRGEIDMLRRLSSLTPAYYGMLCPQEDLESREITSDSYLLLGDLTCNFRKACVLDLKMGQQSYEPDALPSKREREIAKYPEQEKFGFRIVGMRTYDLSHPESDDGGYLVFDKHYGRSLKTPEEVKSAFDMFFKQAIVPDADERLHDEARQKNLSQFDINELEKKWKGGGGSVRRRVVADLLRQLQIIRKWFEQNATLRFYSSSLLFMYEGDLSVENPHATTLRMIDFGHVRRELGGDHSYLHGIRHVHDILQDILRQE